jgi:exodeoxyribonuclease-5
VRAYNGFGGEPPRAGEPVMCLRNMHEKGLYNGAVYRLKEDYVPFSHEISLSVDFRTVNLDNVRFEGVDGFARKDDRDCTPFYFGYAMTVHKAQGSEWFNTIVVDEYSRSDERKEWLYTAITRASDRCLIVDKVSS